MEPAYFHIQVSEVRVYSDESTNNCWNNRPTKMVLGSFSLVGITSEKLCFHFGLTSPFQFGEKQTAER